MNSRTSRPGPASDPGRPATPRSLIVAEDGTDILMRRGLEQYAPSAQVSMFESAQALEDFRLGGGPGTLERAETCADRAVTTFQLRTGEHDVAAWQVAVTYLVEIAAARYSADRMAVFDPAPPVPSLFTPVSPLRLEKITPEGHLRVLDAGRALHRARHGDAMDTARAQQAIHGAARLVAAELDGLSMPLWVLICRYGAELLAYGLRPRTPTGPAVTI
ncbi:hypothetical protein ACFXKW_32040 [Streptomyces sp. NPDC059193]|uniref:hypothetical protein n=1 Tax=Streptomyces sp. NPDC059193 TaxID=3346763 RepID=UPI0036925B3B